MPTNTKIQDLCPNIINEYLLHNCGISSIIIGTPAQGMRVTKNHYSTGSNIALRWVIFASISCYIYRNLASILLSSGAGYQHAIHSVLVWIFGSV